MGRRSMAANYLIESVPAELSQNTDSGARTESRRRLLFLHHDDDDDKMMIIIEPHPTRVSPVSPGLGLSAGFCSARC